MFDLQPTNEENMGMKRGRITSFLDRQQIFSSRSTDLLRAITIRVALIATIFGCTASAIAGDHGNGASGASPVARLRQWFQTGQASWYGLHFQGRKTATGEKYDMNALTCAHRSLPLGSWIRVTNLRNRKTVLVRVNDRGPNADNRIVDLSYAAANAVGLHGTGKVKLEPVTNDEIASFLLAQVPANPILDLQHLLPSR